MLLPIENLCKGIKSSSKTMIFVILIIIVIWLPGNTPGEYKDFMFEGNSRVLENGSLVFERVAKDSEGHYLCEARNDIGAGLSKLIFLKVNGK